METNCDLQLSAERTTEQGACSRCSNSDARRRLTVKKKKLYVIFALCMMNIATCVLLLFVYTSNHSLLVVGFLNLAFTLLTAIAIVAGVSQLVIVCVIYKVLCGTYLSFLICKFIDAVITKRPFITPENIWVIVAFTCTVIEISFFRLLMGFKVEMEQERTQPPPKYSSCALASSPTNSQLPTYDEALKMIEQQKDETKQQSSSGMQSSPIYTIQNSGTTRLIFRDNLFI